MLNVQAWKKNVISFNSEDYIVNKEIRDNRQFCPSHKIFVFKCSVYMKFSDAVDQSEDDEEPGPNSELLCPLCHLDLCISLVISCNQCNKMAQVLLA